MSDSVLSIERPSAIVTFHDGVKDLLARGNRVSEEILYPVDRRASIKDVIEALGPPHTEVGAILGPDGPWDFNRLLQPGDRVEVHPLTPPVDVTQPTLLRPEPLPGLTFAVDANIGKLTTLLRLLGLDTAYDRSLDDAALAELATAEGRVLLSRDSGLLKRKMVKHGRLIRAMNPLDQLREVVEFYGLKPPFGLFTRCLRCNVLLRRVPKEEIIDRLEPLTRKHFEEFSICPSCERIYWSGSHFERMRSWLSGVLGLGSSLNG